MRQRLAAALLLVACGGDNVRPTPVAAVVVRVGMLQPVAAVSKSSAVTWWVVR